MSIIADIATTMQDVLTTVANTAAQSTGFVQRASKLTGAGLVQTLVFSSLSNPDAATDDLAQTAATLDIPVAGSGIVQHCTEAAAACLQQVLGGAARAGSRPDDRARSVAGFLAGTSHHCRSSSDHSYPKAGFPEVRQQYP